jgi:hypothetical protein
MYTSMLMYDEAIAVAESRVCSYVIVISFAKFKVYHDYNLCPKFNGPFPNVAEPP